MYNDPACKPWTSRTWAPHGYASRKDVEIENKAQVNARMQTPSSTTDIGNTGKDGEEVRHEGVNNV